MPSREKQTSTVLMEKGEKMKLIDVESLSELKYCLDNCPPTEWQQGWNDAIDTIIGEVPEVDIDAITESHEKIGYDKGVRDGYAQATSEVRYGHWIERTKVYPALFTDSTYIYECSNCGYMDTHGANVEVPYCWHCGAKMDEVRDE